MVVPVTPFRVYELAGVERWNGTVEWTTGVAALAGRVSRNLKSCAII